MDVSELSDTADELRDHEADNSLRVLMIKLGQIARSLHQLEYMEIGDDGDLSEREADRYYRDMFGGLVVAAFEFAAEHDIDPERAIEDRIERMERMKRAEAIGDSLGEPPEGVDTELDADEDRSFH